MKTLLLIMVIVLCGCVYDKTCTEKYWRGNAVQCCSNATALRVGTGDLVWVKERPFVCGVSAFSGAGKTMWTASLVIIIVSTICCVACHAYYLVAYIAYRKVRHFYQCQNKTTKKKGNFATVRQEVVNGNCRLKINLGETLRSRVTYIMVAFLSIK